MIAELRRHYQNNWNNWALLRAETDRIGAEIEQWSYEALDRAAEEQLPIEKNVGEWVVHFQVDCYDKLPNGELAICVDAHGGPPTLLGVKPSYRFFKRRDGSVYY
jgi:hypothetical protein